MPGDLRLRAAPHFLVAMPLDTDEASAANLKTGAQRCLDGIQSPG
jgi:acetate kinase